MKREKRMAIEVERVENGGGITLSGDGNLLGLGQTWLSPLLSKSESSQDLDHAGFGHYARMAVQKI